MEFNSVVYVVFLAAVVLLYRYGARTYGAQRALIVAASALFYAFWSPSFLLHLVAILSLNYWWSTRMAAAKNPATRKAMLIVGIGVDLGNLFVFKYAGLAADAVDRLALLFGAAAPPIPPVTPLLPLAISFYTFSVISYLVDTYRDERGQARGTGEFLFYAMFFPHLIAGPILRKSEFFPQCGFRQATAQDFSEGLHRIVVGMFQKAVIADNLAIVVDHGYANVGRLSAAEAVVVLVAYAFQIYFDFAGYSAIAIGSARLFGYVFPENFNVPYVASNISEFWRRWHMTLSRWIRDYIYIALGGSRGGRLRTQANLLLTMGIAGLWHGASWNFAVWGLFHGLGLVIHHAYERTRMRAAVVRMMPEPAYRVTAVLVTFVFVTLGWVLFRAPSWGAAARMYRQLIDWGPGMWALDEAYLLKSYGFSALAAYGAAVACGRWSPLRRAIFGVPRRVVLVYLLAMLLVVTLAPLNTDPFIYFRF
jgi:alginate O-acetyltransferase complex protein AlgI